MNHRQRVQAALRGDPVDRVPVALWNHPASDPWTAEEIAADAIESHRRFDWDFVKMMPNDLSVPRAYGCEIETSTAASGTGSSARSISTPDDLRRLPELDPCLGTLGEVTRAVRLTRDALGPDVPIIQTIFSPLTVIHSMCPGTSFQNFVAHERDALIDALAPITATTIALGRAALDAGADGVFFATREATLDELTEPEFEELGKAFDRQVLKSLGERAWLRLLHVCRESIMAEVVADYPVEAINWDCHHNFPSLREAPGIWPFAIVGGLDRDGSIANGEVSEIEAEVRRVVAVAGPRFILAAGCALPPSRLNRNLDAIRRAVGAI